MIKRRSLLTAILFAPVVIPSAGLMSLSWHSSKLLLPRPTLRHLSANWTINYDDDGDPEWMIDTEVENEIALILRQEIDREFDQIRSISNSGYDLIWGVTCPKDDEKPVLEPR
jgi:hypothetical protein